MNVVIWCKFCPPAEVANPGKYYSSISIPNSNLCWCNAFQACPRGALLSHCRKTNMRLLNNILSTRLTYMYFKYTFETGLSSCKVLLKNVLEIGLDCSNLKKLIVT